MARHYCEDSGPQRHGSWLSQCLPVVQVRSGYDRFKWLRTGLLQPGWQIDREEPSLLHYVGEQVFTGDVATGEGGLDTRAR